MTSNIEFEIKSKIDSASQIARLIGDTKPIGEPILQSDVYYDTAERTLYRNAVFLRVRNGRLVEVKAAPPSAGTEHLWCKEISIPLTGSSAEFDRIGHLLRKYLGPARASYRDLADLTTAFKLETLVEVRKERVAYRLDGAELAIDSVRGLGLFVELEVHDASRRQDYLQLVTQSRLLPVPVGYVELLLRTLEPGTYRQGRYLLPEDRVEDSPGPSAGL